jgi:dihydrofolate reductase
MGARAVIVAGGGEVYAQALPIADRLELTFVHARPEGDAVFPAFERAAFRESARSEHPAGAEDEFSFAFARLDRIS